MACFQLRRYSAARHTEREISPCSRPPRHSRSSSGIGDMDDSSDILGGQLNVARPDTLLPWFTPSFTGLLFIATIAVAAFYGLQFLGPHIRLYQEKRYRKCVGCPLWYSSNTHKCFFSDL